MSCTLRYDIGVLAHAALQSFDHRFDALAETFGAAEAYRWAGIRRNQHHRAITFAIKLPKQIAEAVQLYTVVNDVLTADAKLANSNKLGGLARLSLTIFRKKLILGLGLPAVTPRQVEDDEQALVAGRLAEPGDLAGWAAYADWLQEHDSVPREEWGSHHHWSDITPDRHTRGLVIAGWLNDKAQKIKYGVPVLLRGKDDL